MIWETRRTVRAATSIVTSSIVITFEASPALRRGKVVTRTELYEHLFDENDASLSNLLDVHVSNIRKKIGHEFITTRRGHGYCIEG